MAVEELQTGDPAQIGGYRLLGRLGAGGMGVVYLGRSPGGRLVAVKAIRSDLADSPDFRTRFAREVAAARKVSGIFTTPVVDADPQGAPPWLVTGYVEGPSLQATVSGYGPMTPGDVAALARGLAEGLGAIHAAGVVHRDLKPSNVLLAADGPRIIDFGISRAAEATTLTHTGIAVGSPGFMSPEQATGGEVGPASDVFSLGAVLAYAGTGRNPFGDGPPLALLYQVVHGPPALRGIPEPLRSVIESCMAKDPAARPKPADLLTRLSGEDLTPRALAGTAAAPAPYAPATASASYAPAAVPAPHAPAAVPDADGAGTATTGTRTLVEARPALARPVPVRRRVKGWAGAVAAVVIGVGAAGIWLTAHYTDGPRLPPGSHVGAAAAGARPPAPRAVVEEFIAAINARDWSRVWQLGGRNLGFSYPSFVAGFRLTRRDVLTSLTTSGDTVSARILAYETTGVVQTYALRYTVVGGVVTSGQQTLLATHLLPGHCRAGDSSDGRARCLRPGAAAGLRSSARSRG